MEETLIERFKNRLRAYTNTLAKQYGIPSYIVKMIYESLLLEMEKMSTSSIAMEGEEDASTADSGAEPDTGADTDSNQS